MLRWWITYDDVTSMYYGDKNIINCIYNNLAHNKKLILKGYNLIGIKEYYV